MIDPDIWQDEKLSKMDFAGRLFFIGLISQANDYGKLRGNPKLLKSLIFPYEDNAIKIEEYVEQLADLKIIIIYEVNGEMFIKIKNWDKYQTLVHPAKDTIPDPTQETIKSISRDLQPQVKLVKLVKSSKGKLKDTKTFPFEEIWAQYPKRVGKKEAERHFRASVKTEQDWEDIQTALKNYLEYLKRKQEIEEFIQYGSTWFNNWRDWVNYKKPVNREEADEGRFNDDLPKEKPELTEEELKKIHEEAEKLKAKIRQGTGKGAVKIPEG